LVVPKKIDAHQEIWNQKARKYLQKLSDSEGSQNAQACYAENEKKSEGKIKQTSDRKPKTDVEKLDGTGGLFVGIEKFKDGDDEKGVSQ